MMTISTLPLSSNNCFVKIDLSTNLRLNPGTATANPRFAYFVSLCEGKRRNK